jgi:hypothetical protein
VFLWEKIMAIAEKLKSIFISTVKETVGPPVIVEQVEILPVVRLVDRGYGLKGLVVATDMEDAGFAGLVDAADPEIVKEYDVKVFKNDAGEWLMFNECGDPGKLNASIVLRKPGFGGSTTPLMCIDDLRAYHRPVPQEAIDAIFTYKNGVPKSDSAAMILALMDEFKLQLKKSKPMYEPRSLD